MNRIPPPACILCVEDEEPLRRDIADELAEAGYAVIEACSGEEALALLRTMRPDLILCDISMPRLDGYQVLAATREKGPDFADIPFVFLSALGNPREIVEGKRRGADDYLVKPIDYDLLLATIEARLRQIERIHLSRTSKENNPGPADPGVMFGLTPTEERIAAALAQGRSRTQIAEDFSVSRTTVAFHMRNIFQKTGTGRQAELVSLLLRSGSAAAPVEKS